MSVQRRRELVKWLQQAFKVSERRACAVLSQARATQRRPVARNDDADGPVREAMLSLVKQFPQWGYRKIGTLLRAAGWAVNHKRLHRLWREAGLRVPKATRTKRAVGSKVNACDVLRAERPNHVWTWDFVHDRTLDGRGLKWLSVVDEFTRECLALEVGRTMDSRSVISLFTMLMIKRGKPGMLRSDNGPEFIAKALQAWVRGFGSEVIYIEPGAPWQNGYSESFNAQLRRELLNCESFASVREAQVLANRWRETYNTVRPHGSLGYQTPAAYARAVAGTLPSLTGSLSAQGQGPAAPRQTAALAPPGQPPVTGRRGPPPDEHAAVGLAAET